MSIRKRFRREPEAENQDQQPNGAVSVNAGDLNFTALAAHLANLNRIIGKDEISETDLRDLGMSLLELNAHAQAIAVKVNETQTALAKFFGDLEKRASRWPKFEKQIRGIVANFKQGVSKHQK